MYKKLSWHLRPPVCSWSSSSFNQAICPLNMMQIHQQRLLSQLSGDSPVIRKELIECHLRHRSTL
jgi:hypothetical protein